jgi:WD40 repeat protein
LVAGHKGPVVDLDFNPFNDNLIASASEDCVAKLWSIPDGGIGEKNMVDSVQTLSGHKRKIGNVKFHPTANNVLATSGADYAVKVWDVEKGEAKYDIEGVATDLIQNIDWNYDGSLLVASSKDKKVRIIDPRQKKVVSETEAHSGVKGGRSIWLGSREKIFTVGFSKTSEREYALWDPKNFKEPLTRTNVDSASGVLLPFYDNDTSVLFLGGKGDGNIRYYEIVDEAPYIHYLTEFKSNTAARK